MSENQKFALITGGAGQEQAYLAEVLSTHRSGSVESIGELFSFDTDCIDRVCFDGIRKLIGFCQSGLNHNSALDRIIQPALMFRLLA